MKNETITDDRLRTLLRSARTEPELPPGFVPSVWRRIERSEIQETAGVGVWLNRFVERLLAPRIAFTGLAVLLFAGGAAGALHSAADVRQAAQARYVASISPIQ